VVTSAMLKCRLARAELDEAGVEFTLRRPHRHGRAWVARDDETLTDVVAAGRRPAPGP
jgi:hypothetical protein